jgi:hypothetical protein
LFERQRNGEDGSQPGLAPGGDCAVVTVGYAAAHRQTHSSALILITAMQSLKNGKDFIHIFFFEADAIVLDGDFTMRFTGAAAEFT